MRAFLKKYNTFLKCYREIPPKNQNAEAIIHFHEFSIVKSHEEISENKHYFTTTCQKFLVTLSSHEGNSAEKHNAARRRDIEYCSITNIIQLVQRILVGNCTENAPIQIQPVAMKDKNKVITYLSLTGNLYNYYQYR